MGRQQGYSRLIPKIHSFSYCIVLGIVDAATSERTHVYVSTGHRIAGSPALGRTFANINMNSLCINFLE